MTYSHGMPAWEPDAGFALQDLTAFLVTTQLSCRWGQHGGKLVLRIKNVHYPYTENLPEVLGGFMSDSLHVGTAPLLSHWLQFSQGDECLHELPGVTSPDIHRLRCHIPSNTPHKGRVEGGLLSSFLASGNVTASLRSCALIQACTFHVWRQKKGSQEWLFQST